MSYRHNKLIVSWKKDLTFSYCTLRASPPNSPRHTGEHDDRVKNCSETSLYILNYVTKKEGNIMKKVFEVINGGESIADFSRNSNIYYYSLYHTYKKVKKKLKKLL